MVGARWVQVISTRYNTLRVPEPKESEEPTMDEIYHHLIVTVMIKNERRGCIRRMPLLNVFGLFAPNDSFA